MKKRATYWNTYTDLDGRRRRYPGRGTLNGGGGSTAVTVYQGAHPWDGDSYTGRMVRYWKSLEKGISQAWDYVRNYRTWGDVREQGYGVMARGQAVHPDLSVRKELKYLAQNGLWDEYWRHKEGMGAPIPPMRNAPNADLEMAKRLHLLRKRRRYWKKSRFLKGKKRRPKNYY